MRRMHVKVAIAVLMLCAIGLTAGLIIASSGSATEDTGAAPDWLQEEASRILGTYSESSSGAASWSLTTIGVFTEVMPDQGAATKDAASQPIYVVSVDGDFVATHSRPGAEPPRGSQLVLVFNADTHELDGVGILQTPIDPSSFGKSSDLSLQTL